MGQRRVIDVVRCAIRLKDVASGHRGPRNDRHAGAESARFTHAEARIVQSFLIRSGPRRLRSGRIHLWRASNVELDGATVADSRQLVHGSNRREHIHHASEQLIAHLAASAVAKIPLDCSSRNLLRHPDSRAAVNRRADEKLRPVQHALRLIEQAGVELDFLVVLDVRAGAAARAEVARRPAGDYIGG